MRGKERSGVSGLGTLSICQIHHSIPSITDMAYSHQHPAKHNTPIPSLPTHSLLPPPTHYPPHLLTPTNLPHTHTTHSTHTGICRQTCTPTHLLLVGELYLAHWWRSVAVLWLWVVPTGSQRGGWRGRTEGDRGKTTGCSISTTCTHICTHSNSHTHARTLAHTHTHCNSHSCELSMLNSGASGLSLEDSMG